jgi:hypothetical protein
VRRTGKPVYPGLGIGVQGVGKESKQITSESVRAAVRASYEGGAAGVCISRNYSEAMRASLSAVGDALTELGIGETIPAGISQVKAVDRDPEAAGSDRVFWCASGSTVRRRGFKMRQEMDAAIRRVIGVTVCDDSTRRPRCCAYGYGTSTPVTTPPEQLAAIYDGRLAGSDIVTPLVRRTASRQPPRVRDPQPAARCHPAGALLEKGVECDLPLTGPFLRPTAGRR